MNRIILKVKLITKTSAELTLVYVDKRFLSTGNTDFKYFYEDSQDFIIYSFNDFTYTINSLKLPSLERYKPCETIKLDFISEQKMHNWLKCLYNTLKLWNNNYTDFQKQSDYDDRPKKLILNGETWIL